MKMAALQMVSSSDVGRNLDTAWRLLEQASQQGVQIAALPEYFCFMGLRDKDKLQVAEVAGQGPIQQMLSDAARQFKLWVIGGTVPLRLPDRDDRLHNACLVFNPQGQQAARYDKIHLFAFDNGRERYDESALLEPGQSVVVAEVQVEGQTLQLGLSVCYDLRFPELYRHLSQLSPTGACDVMCVPSAFTYTTGQAHWELLLRARAIENQCYVLAPAQGGVHDNGRRTWGHSLVADPWGSLVALCEEGEGLAVSDVDPQRLNQVRTQLPALGHRRLG
jgi:deaminated glutathione amidase